MNCPHCGTVCEATAAFCPVCGKAVSAGAGGPRVVHGEAEATTHAGRALQSDALARQMKRAFGALLAVAILQTIFGAMMLVMALNNAGPLEIDDEASIPVLAVLIFGIAAVFFALAIWARRNPFPAAITGLVLFLTVHLLDALADPSAIIRGLLIKIIVIVVLIRAISAGAKYRAIKRGGAAS